MALIICRECKKEVSSSAKTCPHCGIKQQPSLTWLFISIGCLILILLFSSGTNNTTSQSSTAAELTTSTEQPATEQAIAVVDTPIVNSWTYNDFKDDTSGKTGQIASIRSNNYTTLDFPYRGKTYATLSIRKHPRHGKDIYVSVDQGQLHCQYDNCYISIRYDEGPVLKNYVSEPADNSNTTYFLSKTNTVKNSIKKSKKMYIELMFFSQGSYTFEFNTENLDPEKVN